MRMKRRRGNALIRCKRIKAATRHAHVPAMARVARCYASGEGAPFNLSESSAWLERGAAAGETLTQTSAGRPAAAARNGGAETHPGEGRNEP